MCHVLGDMDDVCGAIISGASLLVALHASWGLSFSRPYRQSYRQFTPFCSERSSSTFCFYSTPAPHGCIPVHARMRRLLHRHALTCLTALHHRVWHVAS